MNRQHLLTILISSCLFMFLTALFYTLYCYSFYNKNQLNTYIDNINNKKYDFIYSKYQNRDKITEKDFYSVINNSFDKDNLLNIYNTYYQNILEEKDFLDKFYYGDINIAKENVDFKTIGKTTYGSRRELFINSIKYNKKDDYISLSLIKQINFITEKNTTINIDNNIDIECSKNCKIENLLGGIHTIIIKQSNKEYFTILNINESNQEIDLMNLEQTVLIKEEKDNDKVTKYENISIGTYYLKECYMEQKALCPTNSKSYLELNEDNTVYLHLYSAWEIAYTEYWGTFTIENNFLILNFDYHTYTPFDYDTRTYSTVEVNSPSTQKYKIEGNNLIGDKYKFYY